MLVSITNAQCNNCQGTTIEHLHDVHLLQNLDMSLSVCVCRGVQRVAKSTGCALSGFVLVKKVPGTLHFLPKSPGHSFDYHAINMSHQVGYMYYGNKPSPRRRQVGLLPWPLTAAVVITATGAMRTNFCSCFGMCLYF